MNVTCPECRSVFRVDPSKLPASVLKARCSVCGGLITVTPSASLRDEFAPAGARSDRGAAPLVAPPPSQRPELPPAPRPAAADVTAPNLGAATAAALLGRAEVPGGAGVAGGPAGRGPGAAPPRAPSPARAAMPFVRPATAGSPPPAAAAVPAPFAVRATPPAGQGAPRRPINPFLANDPNAKARRLARALISDMVTYFPGKREEGLRTGALKQLFEEEITKSYGEYVEQVGREFAETTPFFQEALNEILAGGRKLF